MDIKPQKAINMLGKYIGNIDKRLELRNTWLSNKACLGSIEEISRSIYVGSLSPGEIV